MGSHSAAPEQTEGFRDPTTLTRWTRGFLYASIASYLVRIWLNAGDQLGGRAGASAAIGSDPIVLGVAEITIWLITSILVLNWIHRANHNARQLGATDLRFTPGWAIGWYFVPIAWFWKPYQAMTEIWRASRNPLDWRGESASPLMLWWWILWLGAIWGVVIVNLAVARTLAAMVRPGVPFDAAGLESLVAVTGLVAWILEVPLALVLLVIIDAVHRMQMQHRARQAAAGWPRPSA